MRTLGIATDIFLFRVYIEVEQFPLRDYPSPFDMTPTPSFWFLPTATSLFPCCFHALYGNKGFQPPPPSTTARGSYTRGATGEGQKKLSGVKTWVACRALLDSVGVGELRLVDSPAPRGERGERVPCVRGRVVGHEKDGKRHFVFGDFCRKYFSWPFETERHRFYCK